MLTVCSGARMFQQSISGAIVFFASSDSDFITGQMLVADGGSCLH